MWRKQLLTLNYFINTCPFIVYVRAPTSKQKGVFINSDIRAFTLGEAVCHTFIWRRPSPLGSGHKCWSIHRLPISYTPNITFNQRGRGGVEAGVPLDDLWRHNFLVILGAWIVPAHWPGWFLAMKSLYCAMSSLYFFIIQDCNVFRVNISKRAVIKDKLNNYIPWIQARIS